MGRYSNNFLVTVEGGGEFPLDMLRYDRATPYTEQDSGVIASTMPKRQSGAVRVQLLLDRMPTRERWESFNWKVVATERLPRGT